MLIVLTGPHRGGQQWAPPPNYPPHYGGQVMSEQYRHGGAMPPYGPSMGPCISPHSRADPCSIPIQVGAFAWWLKKFVFLVSVFVDTHNFFLSAWNGANIFQSLALQSRVCRSVTSSSSLGVIHSSRLSATGLPVAAACIWNELLCQHHICTTSTTFLQLSEGNFLVAPSVTFL